MQWCPAREEDEWTHRVADHVGAETAVAAGLFQRRGTAATFHRTPWAERIVMVADDADFDEWKREWLAKNGLTADQPAARGGRLRRWFGRGGCRPRAGRDSAEIVARTRQYGTV